MIPPPYTSWPPSPYPAEPVRRPVSPARLLLVLLIVLPLAPPALVVAALTLYTLGTAAPVLVPLLVGIGIGVILIRPKLTIGPRRPAPGVAPARKPTHPYSTRKGAKLR